MMKTPAKKELRSTRAKAKKGMDDGYARRTSHRIQRRNATALKAESAKGAIEGKEPFEQPHLQSHLRLLERPGHPTHFVNEIDEAKRRGEACRDGSLSKWWCAISRQGSFRSASA